LPKLIVAAAALAAAAPAFAQSGPDRAEEEILRELPPPGEIERMGETLGRVADAVMDVPVGPIVDAIDPGRRLHRRHRDETLGDIASRDDPYARERVRDSIGAATVGLGAAVAQLAILTPVLRASLEDAARRMEEAMRGHRGRDWDRRDGPDRDHPERDYPERDGDDR
jgi:hypothetical protein